jgi:hypothetical protein
MSRETERRHRSVMRGWVPQSSNTTLRAASDLRNPVEQERQRK